MRKAKIETEVLACEICGEPIAPTINPFTVERGDEIFNFYHDCVDDLLVKAAKGEIKTE